MPPPRRIASGDRAASMIRTVPYRLPPGAGGVADSLKEIGLPRSKRSGFHSVPAVATGRLDRIEVEERVRSGCR